MSCWKSVAVAMAGLFVGLAPAVTVSAQSPTRVEFLESTSPLKTGGTVTSRYTPEEGLKTWIVAGEPRIADGRVPAGTPTSAVSDATGPAQSGATGSSGASAVYPYPGEVPVAGANAWTVPQMTAVPPVIDPFQSGSATSGTLPTLGITPQSSLRPWLRSGTGWVGAPGAMPPPAASLPPQLPGNGMSAGPVIQYPQVIPPATRNGDRYQPLLPLRNMPPGTWLGQGFLGQPKAYVDGQPIRNLFRYMFLW